MSTQQPEALRLADWCLRLSTISDAYSEEAYEKAALELRRLHDVNTEMLERLKGARQWHNGDKWRDGCTFDQRAAWELQRDLLDATIAKATGETK